MRIKIFFIVMLFLSGIAVQFAGAMGRKLELVCKGEITSMNYFNDKKITCTFKYIDEHSAPREHERTWNIKKDGSAKSDDGLAELKQQDYTAHSHPIIMSQVSGSCIVTASYDGQEKESCIRYNIITKPVQIKMFDRKKRTIPAIDTNLKICCRSEILLSTLADEKQSREEISLNLTEEQFMVAWNYMRGVTQKLADMSINQLCDLIVADSVLKIKTDNEYNLSKDCLSIIKNKFDCETDAEKGKYLAQTERLPENYKHAIALHIAKNFVDQNQDGTKYSFVTSQNSVHKRDRIVINKGGLLISKESYYKNMIAITYKKDQRSSAFTHRLTLSHSSEVYEVVISEKENKFSLPVHVVTLAGNQVTVWFSVDGDKPSYRSTVLKPDGDGGTIISIDITSDGRFVAAATQDKLQIWDVETGSCFVILKHQFFSEDQITFGKGKSGKLYIRYRNSKKFGEDKEIDLTNFLERVEFVKNYGVCAADFVSRLAKKIPSEGSIILTQAEQQALKVLSCEKAIEPFFSIDLTKTAEQPDQEQAVIENKKNSNQPTQANTPNQSGANQPAQPPAVTTIKNNTPEQTPIIDEKKPNEGGKPTSFFTLQNFMKYAALPACVIGMLCLIYHNMNH